MTILADGTYTYTATGGYGPGIEVKATVRGGTVTAWSRNGWPAGDRDIATLSLTRILIDEIAERQRLGTLLAPVEFEPAAAAQEVAA